MSDIPRIIVYANPDELILVARMAKRLQSPEYEWPDDGWTVFSYGDGDSVTDLLARRNKGGFTIRSLRSY